MEKAYGEESWSSAMEMYIPPPPSAYLEECCLEDFEKIELDDDNNHNNKNENRNNNNNNYKEAVEILLGDGAFLEKMVRLELSGIQLRFLPKALFHNLHGLCVLNLSHNQLQVIPDAVTGLKKLEELDVSSNLLKSLPDSIGLLPNLKVLNVSVNSLNALPTSIGSCRSLVEMNASSNNLMYLPRNIGIELENLEIFLIRLNSIQSLPTSICEMTSLRVLDAQFNKLRGLPYAIGRLANLEVLNVSCNFNGLTELPESVGDLAKLKELDLAHNEFRALPNTFGQLGNLTKLNLDHNPLVIPPPEIVSYGVEAVKAFMRKRQCDTVAAEDRRHGRLALVLRNSKEKKLLVSNNWMKRFEIDFNFLHL